MCDIYSELYNSHVIYDTKLRKFIVITRDSDYNTTNQFQSIGTAVAQGARSYWDLIYRATVPHYKVGTTKVP